MSLEDRAPPTRIQIPGDELALDAEWCELVLGGATTRTARNLDTEGCPYVMVGGRKFRPLNEGREWLAARIQRKNQAPQRGPRARR
jgi:hypothetical protein